MRVQFESLGVLLRNMGFSDLWKFWRKTCLFMSLSIIYNSVAVKIFRIDYTHQSNHSAFSTGSRSAKLSVLFTAPAGSQSAY